MAAEGQEPAPKTPRQNPPEGEPLRDPIPCDEFSIHTNAFGVSMVFGVSHHGGPRKGQGPIVKQRVLVSWEMAKVMREMLSKSIFAYEQTVGEIPLPPDLKKNLGMEE